MKKQTNSLTVKQNKPKTGISARQRLFLLIPGCLLLTGFWGIVIRELMLETRWFFVLLPAITTLALGLVLQWEKKWQSITAIGVLILAGVCFAVFHRSLSAGIAGFMEQVDRWWFLRTGIYSPGYEHAGGYGAVLLLGAVVSGFFTAWLLRMKWPLFQLLLTVALLVLWMTGLLQCGWPLAVYLLGALLTFAPGQDETLTFSGAVALTLAAVTTAITLLSGFAPTQTAFGAGLKQKLHSLRWEDGQNPLPEGKLDGLGVYAPTDEPALEVTMEQWTPLYLRGFVAGSFTEAGWEPLAAAQLENDADLLYALQESHFFAADQTAKAWRSIEADSDNGVSVRILGACGSVAYLPYGAGSVTEGVLSSNDLRREGMYAPAATAYSARLYPIEDSYLLQAELKDTDSAYRSAEAVYRDWVYKQYLAVPEEEYRLLSKHIAASGDMTTVQAKREILELLEELLDYNEKVLTDAGQRGFVSYVTEVSRSGYSVHYATLATLLMRCCGIPARYVEGYVVSPSQAEALSGGETLTLTQSNAHAWTEYYLDGVGWVPFDATPGYSDILLYELPTEGQPTQEETGDLQQTQQEPEQQRQPQTRQEQQRQSQRVYVREAVSYGLLVILLTVLVMVLRTVLLRRKLRKKQQAFYGADLKKACAGILCYMLTLTSSVKAMDRNLPVSALAEQTAQILDSEVSAQELEALINQVWYSDHAISVQQHSTALQSLEAAQAVWKQRVSALKRFRLRFISCKVI